MTSKQGVGGVGNTVTQDNIMTIGDATQQEQYRVPLISK
jgi:hypothetical protein